LFYFPRPTVKKVIWWPENGKFEGETEIDVVLVVE
jgi:hypothetical protein